MNPSFLLLLSVVALVMTILAVYSIKDRVNRRWDRIFTLSLEKAIRFPNLVTAWEKKRAWRGILNWLVTFPITLAVCRFTYVQVASRFDIPSGTVAPFAVFIGAIYFAVWLVLYVITLVIVGFFIKRKLKSVSGKLSSV